MNVSVHQPRQDGFPIRVDDARVGRDGDLPFRADGFDAIPLDDNDGIIDRVFPRAVDECAALERHDWSLGEQVERTQNDYERNEPSDM